MSTFRFPETGTTVSWPRYRNGPVVVLGGLPFREGRVHVGLSFPRSGLRMLKGLPGASPSHHLDLETGRIANAVAIYAEGAPERPYPPQYWLPSGATEREAQQLLKTIHEMCRHMQDLPYMLPTGARTHAALFACRHDLLLLARVLKQPDGYRKLRLLVRLILLPEELLEWSKRLPRGRSKRSWPLKRCLPLAFGLAQSLLNRSKREFKLGRKIKECIEEDEISDRYWEQFQDDQELALNVILVDRAFRGAWKRYGLQPPCSAANPREVLRSHSYGKESRKQYDALDEIKRLDPQWEEQLLGFAEDLLLGPPGTAARSYGLLT